jgi:sterol desaturase/sphingolipid hydroxylase (fatty acid hydroxylase superfamily)
VSRQVPFAGSVPERVFAVTVFPVVMTAALLACVALQRAGHPVAALGFPTLVPAFFILLAERVFPRFGSWKRSHHDVPTDLAFAPLSSVASGFGNAAATAIAVPAAVWLSSGSGLWPDVPWPVGLGLALVVAELPKYWLHRMMHEHDALWRFHATHHSVPRLYFLNATRFHPVDIGLDALVGIFPLVLLGCPPEILLLFGVASAVHGFFQHANLQLRLGPLNWFFSMAELHRWHHSKLMREANHNYGQNVIVWDVVFGTRFLPADREPPEDIGIPDLPAFPKRFWPQLASPFRWRRIREESASA